MRGLSLFNTDDLLTQKILARYSANTRKAYRLHARKWTSYCRANNIHPLEPSLQQLCNYLENCGHAPPTCKQFLSMLSLACRLSKVPDITKHDAVKATLFAITKAAPPSHQSGAIDQSVWEQLREYFLGLIDGNTMRLLDRRDFMMCWLLRACLLRVSEVTAVKIRHIKFDDRVLFVPRSKTDQQAEGEVLYIPLILREHLHYYIQMITGDNDHAPAFPKMQRDDIITEEFMSVDYARYVIKQRLIAAGIDGASSHGFRIGMTQDLAEDNASLLNIQRAGRWKSPDMPAYYTRNIEATKGAVAQYFDGDKNKSR